MTTADAVLRHVYREPKFLATMEWLDEYSSGAQFMRQVPRLELEAYVATGEHPNPERRVSIELHEMPDFDWWEPRYDQPWRRQAACDRGESA